jgi:hypothetical protein
MRNTREARGEERRNNVLKERRKERGDDVLTLK